MAPRDGGASADTYRDRWNSCTATELQIRGYYFPWGTKHVAYRQIKGVRRVEMGLLTGKGRIWGTASPGYWASFDPRRPTENVGLVLDLGKRVKPFITPDDPETVERLVRERVGLGSGSAGGRRQII